MEELGHQLSGGPAPKAQPVGVDGEHSTEQTCSGAVMECTHIHPLKKKQTLDKVSHIS